MLYYSTQHVSPAVSFKTATLLGQAPDKGLYFPEKIPVFNSEWKNLRKLSKEALAYQIIEPYTRGCIPDKILQRIVAETLDFGFPLVPVTDDIYALELFHGPTLAFKDVGARFMSRCLGFFNTGNTQKVTVLVATSGDTGGAVANGFENVAGIEVIILYPSGKVSPVQELQLTTCASNITALELEGTFDDCQAIVKQAFLDTDLNNVYQLTSANSINIARWLPQQLYYALALQQWPHDTPPVVSVPSGNFGNICAGMLAWASGLPVHHFIAACNANDVVPRYLQSGNYEPMPAIATISNAMDVGSPSNFVRILQLFESNPAQLSKMLSGFTFSDNETMEAMQLVYQSYGYTLDPHGAVAYLALQQWLGKHEHHKGIFLATAHPVKFPDVVETATGKPAAIPDAVQPLLQKQKVSTLLPATYAAFKTWALQRSH